MALVCSHTTMKFVCDPAILIRSPWRSGKREKIGLLCRYSLQYRNLETHDFLSRITHEARGRTIVFFFVCNICRLRALLKHALFFTVLKRTAAQRTTADRSKNGQGGQRTKTRRLTPHNKTRHHARWLDWLIGCIAHRLLTQHAMPPICNLKVYVCGRTSQAGRSEQC